MNTTYYIIAVVLILLVLGGILGPIFMHKKRTSNYQKKYGDDYDATVKTMGNQTKAQTEMDARLKHVGTLNIRALSEDEHSRFLAAWTVIQAKFVDNPAQATVEADHLIMEVMQTRNYPISDFEQRAADVSINYPKLVANYRAARAIAIKNEHHEATTDELRTALINYRSLFDELLEPGSVVVEKK